MDTATEIPAEVMARMQEAAENAAKGIRDPKALKRMDRMREELRKRIGIVDLAVPLLRETRDE